MKPLLALALVLALSAPLAPASARCHPAARVRAAAVSRGDPRTTASYTYTASWYDLPGRQMADGAVFEPWEMVAASRTLPFGARLQVGYEGRSVEVMVTDRGPWVVGRDLDLSEGAARALGMIEQGVARVSVSILR